VNSNFDDVVEFQAKFGVPMAGAPQLLDRDYADFKLGHIEEEFGEIKKAQAAGDLAGVADGLVDLVYVALGTAAAMGLPWQALWDAVQTANLAKRRVERGEESPRGSGYDVVKPTGWTPPPIEEVLERAASGNLACGHRMGGSSEAYVCRRHFTHRPEELHSNGVVSWAQGQISGALSRQVIG
jgi:hypothetical protein